MTTSQSLPYHKQKGSFLVCSGFWAGEPTTKNLQLLDSFLSDPGQVWYRFCICFFPYQSNEHLKGPYERAEQRPREPLPYLPTSEGAAKVGWRCRTWVTEREMQWRQVVRWRLRPQLQLFQAHTGLTAGHFCLTLVETSHWSFQTLAKLRHGALTAEHAGQVMHFVFLASSRNSVFCSALSLAVCTCSAAANIWVGGAEKG